MEKDKTFELKDSLNFNNTFKDSNKSPNEHTQIEDNFDKLRTYDDLDDERFIISGVEEVCETSDNGNGEGNDDFKRRE